MTFKVTYTKIIDIFPHKNADSLEFVKVYGWDVIVSKNKYKVNDPIFFVPIDSVLSKELELLIFPEGSKIKLNNSRVRTIKIRQEFSQGLLLSEEDVRKYLNSKGFKSIQFELEKDYQSILDIRKYEPPAPKFSQINSVSKSRKIADQPLFHTYNGLENIKFYPDLFQENELVHVQLKLHGTNARLSMLPTVVNSFWKKLKKFFKLLPAYEIRYGSNNVDITAKSGSYSGYYNEDIYGQAFRNCDAVSKVKPNEIIYGEVVCEGIQKGYHYGHKKPHFVLFDVKKFDENGEWHWLNPLQVRDYADERGFECIPLLYEGIYSKPILEALVGGKDDYYPDHIKEGIVVKSVANYNDLTMSSKKRALKFINPEYLSKNQTDFH